MKRDMDLIRAILQKIELCETPFGLDSMPEIDGYSNAQISYHIKLLSQAGLIEAHELGEFRSDYDEYVNLNLTWSGQDFLGVANDNSLWSKAKEHVIKPGASWTFDLVLEWLKMKAKEKIGLP